MGNRQRHSKWVYLGMNTGVTLGLVRKSQGYSPGKSMVTLIYSHWNGSQHLISVLDNREEIENKLRRSKSTSIHSAGQQLGKDTICVHAEDGSFI